MRGSIIAARLPPDFAKYTPRKVERGHGLIGLKRGQLRFWPLVMVFFFTVSGGPFGLEEAVRESGGAGALLLIAIVPIAWALPIALMSCELTSAIPAEGGFYVWVKRALGPFWGFQCAWWTWLTSFAEVAIYAHLSAGYVGSLLSEQFGWVAFDSDFVRWLLSLVAIWVCVGINIRGAKAVGANSIVFAVLLLLPLFAMVVVGLIKVASGGGAAPHLSLAPNGQSSSAVLTAGLFIVMWNYYGWDTPSAVAEEIKDPQRSYVKATFVALMLIAVTYLLVVFVGLCFQPNADQWSDDSLPTIGGLVGGPWLGLAVFIAAIVSQIGLFNACLMSYSRMPFVLANDGYMPEALTRTHKVYGTPAVAIILSAVIYSLLSYQEFSFLISLSVITYSAAVVLEFIALWVLRLREPGLHRPFKVPGSWIGLTAVCLLPFAIIIGAIAGEDPNGLVVPLLALLSGSVCFLIAKKFLRPTVNATESTPHE